MAIYIDGISSDTVFLTVEKYPARRLPKKKFETISIPGRNGDIILDDGGYESYTQIYDVFVSAEKAGTNMAKAVNGINSWLYNSRRGFVELSDDYDKDVYRLAYFAGGNDVSNIFDRHGRASLEFFCKPQRFATAGKTFIVSSGAGEVSINCNAPLGGGYSMPAKPVIRLYPVAESVSLTLKISGNVVNTIKIIAATALLSLKYIVIDSERMMIYGENNDGSKVNINSYIHTFDDFPELAYGNGTFIYGPMSGSSSNTFKMAVQPNWWTI